VCRWCLNHIPDGGKIHVIGLRYAALYSTLLHHDIRSTLFSSHYTDYTHYSHYTYYTHYSLHYHITIHNLQAIHTIHTITQLFTIFTLFTLYNTLYTTLHYATLYYPTLPYRRQYYGSVLRTPYTLYTIHYTLYTIHIKLQKSKVYSSHYDVPVPFFRPAPPPPPPPPHTKSPTAEPIGRQASANSRQLSPTLFPLQASKLPSR